MFQKFLPMHLINILAESAAGATYFCLKLAGSINLVSPKYKQSKWIQTCWFLFFSHPNQTATNDLLNSTVATKTFFQVCQLHGLILTMCPLKSFSRFYFRM